jgi:hypothetical protein
MRLFPENPATAAPTNLHHGSTFPVVRKLLVVPLLVLGVIVMHGLGHAGATYAHTAVGMRMDSNHSAPSPAHSTSHLAVMSICAFAILVAAQRVRRTAPPLRPRAVAEQWPALRLTVGPEPPVPRSFV